MTNDFVYVCVCWGRVCLKLQKLAVEGILFSICAVSLLVEIFSSTFGAINNCVCK